MRQRNPEARCGSEQFPCPYWACTGGSYRETTRGALRPSATPGEMRGIPHPMAWFPSENMGECQYEPNFIDKKRDDLCGKHPDFFLEEEPEMRFGIDIVTQLPDSPAGGE